MSYDEILETAKKRMEDAYAADLPNRERGEQDMLFLTGEQWPADIRSEREAAGKPCLTINWMPQLVRQVTGQARNVNPAIKVLAGDNEASEDVADIREGLIRQIEYASDASSVYEGAAESAAMCGTGYFRVRTDYEDFDTFNQEILVERIHNPWSVYMDPYAKESHRGDAEWCFITEAMPKDAFKEQYPDASVDDVSVESTTIGQFNWFSGDSVTVAEYFWKEYDEKTLYQAADGSVSEVNPGKGARSRKVMVPRVMWAKISGCDVLEGPKRFPGTGRYMPVFAVTGEEIHLGDTVYRSSVIRFAKDPQVMLNFVRSASAEVVALQPKTPYMATAAQIKGFEDIWRNPDGVAVLPYNPDSMAPPPARVQPPAVSQGLMAEISMATQDLKDTTGVHDANLGKRSNETSGVAIRQRQAESQNATSIYVDNMVKAVAQCGRVINDMIPFVYDTERTIRILGPDAEQKLVQINGVQVVDGQQQPANSMTKGRFDIRIAVGPSYSTRKQEAAESMRNILNVVPLVGQVASDLVIKMQEWPEADRIAERLKKALPPGIIGIDELPEQEQQQAMAQQQQQAQMAEQQQQMQQQAAQIAMQEAAAKAEEAQGKARKANAEAAKLEIEVAAITGQIDQAMKGAHEQGAAVGRATVINDMVNSQ